MDNVVIFICLGVLLMLFILGFLRQKSVSSKHPTISTIRKHLKKIDPFFLKVPIKVGLNNAYTENKSVVYVCLRHPVTKKVYNMNTLIYVTLHELAHVITPDYDNHGTKWQRNFDKLLKQAQQLGIYDPSESIPKDYCGIESLTR